jgi:flotillin
MNQQYMVILAAAGIVLILLINIAIWLSRYTKVGPNQVLIVSGQKRRLPDGSVIGFRIVKGGGTFVFPVIERADVLSLEVITIEMPRSRAQSAGGRAVEADCAAQVKINGDDASIVAAAEHFLSKSQTEIKNVVRPVLEKHLGSVLSSSSIEEAIQNPAACAARVQTSVSTDLGKMGLSLISFTIRNARVAS